MNGEATNCQYEDPRGGMLWENVSWSTKSSKCWSLSGSVPSSVAGAFLLCPHEQEKYWGPNCNEMLHIKHRRREATEGGDQGHGSLFTNWNLMPYLKRQSSGPAGSWMMYSCGLITFMIVQCQLTMKLGTILFFGTCKCSEI